MGEGILIAIVSGLCSFAGTWGAVSVKLAWLREDVNDLKERVGKLETCKVA